MSTFASPSLMGQLIGQWPVKDLYCRRSRVGGVPSCHSGSVGEDIAPLTRPLAEMNISDM